MITIAELIRKLTAKFVDDPWGYKNSYYTGGTTDDSN